MIDGGFEELDEFELYVTSYYFIVTTISTVGYGDIGPTNLTEKCFCIANMIVGVIAFSFATGSLASILSNKDTQEAHLQEKVSVLNSIYKEYCLPLDLYARLKQSLKFSKSRDQDQLNDFLEDLPHKLKLEVSLFIHEQTYKKFKFLKQRSSLFISWICPLFKPYLIVENTHIYYENDEINNIYFMKKGVCGFVLPNFRNAKYIDIPVGEHFGVIDIIGSILGQEEYGLEKLNEWITMKHSLKRQFTTMSNTNCELLSFSIHDLSRMQFEFIEAYDKMFGDGFNSLYKCLQIKMDSMKHCQKMKNQMK